MDYTIEAQDQKGEKTGWFTLLAPVTGGAVTRTSDVQTCLTAAGVLIEVVVANHAAANFVPKILVPDAYGGADIAIVTFTALIANGTYILVLHPSGSDMGNEDKVGVLPRDWKFELTRSAGTADTKVSARFI